jgi:hypothetical protein
MKTITEYQPMIFSLMAGQAEKRALQRRQSGAGIIAVLSYIAYQLMARF